METIASRVIKLRVAIPSTQHELAKNSGVSRHVIAKIESGATPSPRPETMELLSKILNTTPQYLLYGVVDESDTIDSEVMAVALKIQSYAGNRKKLIHAVETIIDLGAV